MPQSAKIVYWEEDGAWLGYFQEYPDYWTQGETLDDLREHLKDLYRDLSSGEPESVRLTTWSCREACRPHQNN
jgi:hypothetical protein